LKVVVAVARAVSSSVVEMLVQFLVVVEQFLFLVIEFSSQLELAGAVVEVI
jgi:hypothetical protein